MSASAGPPPDATLPDAAARKPRFAIFIATACGLGYLPKAPGTFGSLGGILLTCLPWWAFVAISAAYINFKYEDAAVFVSVSSRFSQDPFFLVQVASALVVAGIGVWSASRAARFWEQKDPQRVVIDEVSGQHLTILLGCSIPVWWKPVTALVSGDVTVGIVGFHAAVLSWKYLLAGLILFRLFDIWKPFSVRQAESLPGGWGIMADDWVAAVYAGIGLWIARAVGL